MLSNLGICAVIKDEREDYLREWVNYHLGIGVEFVHIYDNNSAIPIGELLADIPQVQAEQFPCLDGRKHMIAYDDFIEKYSNKVKWTAFIDPDEYIVIRNPPHQLDVFLKDYEEFGGVGLNWLIFGSNNLIDNPSGSQIKAFTRRCPDGSVVNQHIKTIVQMCHVVKSCDGHHYIYKDGKYCVNELKNRVNGAFSPLSYTLACIHHYQHRSFNDYLQKIKRGASSGLKHVYHEHHFRNNDPTCNMVEDLTLYKIAEEKNLVYNNNVSNSNITSGRIE